MKNLNLVRTLALAFYLVIFNVSAELVVIVNPGNGQSSINKSELTRLYMGKSTSLTAVNQVYSTPAYDIFCETYLGKDSAKMKAFWSKQMFMGKGTPPAAYGSDGEVISFVKANPNAIGYISNDSVTSEVKVIAVSD